MPFGTFQIGTCTRDILTVNCDIKLLWRCDELRSLWQQVQHRLTSERDSVVFSGRRDAQYRRVIYWFLTGIVNNLSVYHCISFVPHNSDILNRSYIVDVTAEAIMHPFIHHTTWSAAGSDADGLWKSCRENGGGGVSDIVESFRSSAKQAGLTVKYNCRVPGALGVRWQVDEARGGDGPVGEARHSPGQVVDVLQSRASFWSLPAHSFNRSLRAAVHRDRVSISHHDTGGAQLNGTGGMHTCSMEHVRGFHVQAILKITFSQDVVWGCVYLQLGH